MATTKGRRCRCKSARHDDNRLSVFDSGNHSLHDAYCPYAEDRRRLRLDVANLRPRWRSSNFRRIHLGTVLISGSYSADNRFRHRFCFLDHGEPSGIRDRSSGNESFGSVCYRGCDIHGFDAG